MKPAGQGAAGGVGAVLDQEAQLGVCVGGSRYREDREVDRDSGAGELLQIGGLRHRPHISAADVLMFSDTRMLKEVRR